MTTIGDCAFKECTSLTSITIPNSVTTIGGGAFKECTSLTSITIPNSVTTIGYEAFYGCKKLTSITIPNSVTTIGSYAFKECTSLTSITIPNSVAKIGEHAFEYCTYLNSIILSDSLKEIKSETFKDCQSLTSITIPLNVETIEKNAFVGCSSLTSVTWNARIGSATKIDGNKIASPFYDVLPQISSITFGNQVEVIPTCLCLGMYNLHSIIIPKNVKKIEKNAFQCAPNDLGSVYNLQVVFEGKVDVLSEMCGTWWFFRHGKRRLIIYSPAEYVKYYKSLKDEIFRDYGQEVTVIVKMIDK